MDSIQTTSIAPDNTALINTDAVSSNDDVNESADFLSFQLADELYGVDIKDVEEIRVWEKPTPIPRSPSFVKGVINIRGMIIPVIDLRRRFMVGDCEYLPTTVVIVLRHDCNEEQRLMGLVVDAVSDVISQGASELVAPMGDSAVTPYIQNLLNVDDQVMSLLDTQQLLDMQGILRETV